MTKSFKDKLIIAGLVVLFGSIVLFAFIKTKPIWSGVRIVLNGISNGQSFENPLVKVSGRALHATSLTLNGRRVSTDEDGIFNDTILLQPGYSIIKIEAYDKFGNYSSKTVSVYNNEVRRNYLEDSMQKSSEVEDVVKSEEVLQPSRVE